jgi:sugar phosphate isomerase/epimerase
MMTRLSRRAFLGTTAVAPLLLSARSAGAQTPSDGAREAGPLKIGVASYSLREFPLDRALEMAKALNIRYMTFKDVHIPRTDPPETTKALAEKIRAAGITIMGGGTINMKNDPAQIKKDFEYAKVAGFPLIYISPDPAALDTIEQMAKTYDIRAAIHNHGPEDKHWPRPHDAYAAIKSRDARLGLCIDIGHTIRTGADPVQSCREFKDRLYDLHIKDLASKTDKSSQVEVGRGVMDIPGLFRTLVAIGYQGQVGLEYEIKPKDPLPGMIESIAYMRGVLAGLRPTS